MKIRVGTQPSTRGGTGPLWIMPPPPFITPFRVPTRNGAQKFGPGRGFCRMCRMCDDLLSTVFAEAAADKAEQEALVAALLRAQPSAEELAALLADLADDGPEDAA